MFQKDPSQDPTTAYVKSPVISCKSELTLKRKKKQLEEALEVGSHLDTFVGMRERYLQRENFLVDVASKGDTREGSPSDPAKDGLVRT